jgi:hypothetical protein
MFTEITKVAKDATTENDGKSYDLTRVVVAFMIGTGFPTFLFLCVYSVIHRINFDMIAFGTAFAGMLGGVAAVTGAVAFKQKTDIPQGD